MRGSRLEPVESLFLIEISRETLLIKNWNNERGLMFKGGEKFKNLF